MKKVKFPMQDITVAREYDMLVCGAGLSGIAAAWNAAGRGLKVGIIEYFGKPGGVPVSGILGVVSGFRLENELGVNGAFLTELLERARALGGVTDRHGWAANFAPEKLGMALMNMLKDRNVELLIYTQLIAADTSEGQIKNVFISSKSGIEAIQAKLFVDGTGDGDLAAMAGCPFEIGRKSDGKVQSSSLTFKIGGINMDQVPPTMSDVTKIWQSAPHQVPTNHTVITYLPGTNGEASVNMTHILDCNPLLKEEQLRIRTEGTRQAFEIVNFFRERVPGFKDAYVAEIAEQLGIRETRRIIGDYILTENDVVTGRDFPDQIARGCWGIDIHDPLNVHGETACPHFVISKSYGIPYRCITPQKITNLYIAGRPISATHEAHSASRINGSCIAIGEAIGIAAPMAIEKGDTRLVDVSELQHALKAQGAIFERTVI